MKAIAAIRFFLQQPCPCGRDVAMIMMQEATGWWNSRFRLNLPGPAPMNRGNLTSVNTGSMINAGHYAVRLLLKNAKGLVVSGIDTQ